MSYVSTRIGNQSTRNQQAHARRPLAAAVHNAVEALEGRQLLSTVFISNPTINEGGQLVYTVSLNQAATSAVTVGFSSGGGTAKVNRDYTAIKPGKLTFAAGETTKTITVNTKDNNLFTANKTVLVRLSKPSSGNSLAGKGVGTGTIVNTDAPPVITINNARVTEGNSGSKFMTFTVKMTGGAETPVKVAFATQNVTATSSGGKTADYAAAKGTLTFANSKPQSIKVRIIGDKTPEADEAFIVKLTPAAAPHATVVNPDVPGANFAVGAIVNDDGGTVSAGTTVSTFPPAVAVNPGSTAGVSITLNQISADPVTVHFSTADGTATAGTDYTATSGDVTFNPGETSKTVTVPTSASATTGGTFAVNLSTPSGADIATGSSTVTITNTPLAALTVSDVTVAEGNSGTTNATFTISLSSPATQTVTVDFATADGTATAGSDYTATSGTLTFAAGETSKTVTVSVLGDTVVEPDETFTLNLTNAVNAGIAKAFGTGTITDDDSGNTGPGTTPEPAAGTLNFDEGPNNTTWSVNSRVGPQNSLSFHYSITSTSNIAATDAQIQIFLVTQGSDLSTQTPFKTVDIGAIPAGQTVTGTVDATGGPAPQNGQGYYARLVVNGVAYDTDTGPSFGTGF